MLRFMEKVILAMSQPNGVKAVPSLLARLEEWEHFLPECSIDDLASRRSKFYSKIG
jgi:hypothetical protein